MAQDMQEQRSSNCLFYYLKIIGLVALAIGAIAFATLLLLLIVISDNSGTTYWDIIKSGSMTRQSLGMGMLLAGVFLVGAAAIITWLASLYASFRFAGPMFRFSRNMEILTGSGAGPLIPIRKDDQLQQEARHIEQSVKSLHNHYRELGSATETALTMAASGNRELAQFVSKIRELDRRVQL